jgi:hypothetical protein
MAKKLSLKKYVVSEHLHLSSDPFIHKKMRILNIKSVLQIFFESLKFQQKNVLCVFLREALLLLAILLLDNSLPVILQIRYRKPKTMMSSPSPSLGVRTRRKKKQSCSGIFKLLSSPGIDSPAYVACAGILEQSMGAGNRVGTGLSYRPDWLHRHAESIPWNRFLGSFKVLKYRL